MDKFTVPVQFCHYVPPQQKPTPNTSGSPAPALSPPLQQPSMSRGLQQKVHNIDQLQKLREQDSLYDIDRLQKMRELIAMQEQQQSQRTTFFNPSTGLPASVAPNIPFSATLSAENNRRALDVFGPNVFANHSRQLSGTQPPMQNREITGARFFDFPVPEHASYSRGAHLDASVLKLPSQESAASGNANALSPAIASNLTPAKRSRDSGMEKNLASAPGERAGVLSTSTASTTMTTTTTAGPGSFADSVDQDPEPVKKKRRIDTAASPDTWEPSASSASNSGKMQTMVKRYNVATECARKKLAHNFLEPTDIQRYAIEYKGECAVLARFFLTNIYLGTYDKFTTESEKFYAANFTPVSGAVAPERWRLIDELAQSDLDNLCALLNKYNLIELLCQRDEFKQHASVKSTLPLAIPLAALAMHPAGHGGVADVDRAPERATGSEPVAAVNVDPRMAIILENPVDASSHVEKFLARFNVDGSLEKKEIEDFISGDKNFETVESIKAFLDAIASLAFAIQTRRGFSEGLDAQSMVHFALKQLFGHMPDKEADKKKILFTSGFLVDLAINNFEMCELICGVFQYMKPAVYQGIALKTDFEIISVLHDGVLDFRTGTRKPTNSILENLRAGGTLSKDQVISYFTTALAGASLDSLTDYFQTLEFFLDELQSGSIRHPDLTANDLVRLMLHRMVKTSSASMMSESVPKYLLRLAIKSKGTCDTLHSVLTQLPQDMKNKFRVVRKLEFFLKAHASLKAKFFAPTPIGEDAIRESGLKSSVSTGRQEADKSAKIIRATRIEVERDIHAQGATESRAWQVEKPVLRNTANSSATSLNVQAGRKAGSADKEDRGEEPLFNLDDESET